MRVYKLTNGEGRTYNGMYWDEGTTHTTTGHGQLYGGKGWIDAYTHPLLAVLLDPIHGKYLSKSNAILWEAEADGQVWTDHRLKVEVTSLTTRHEVPVPLVTMEHRVRFGLLCVLAVYDEPSWVAWAREWLDGTDRSANAARAVAEAAYATACRADTATDAPYVVACRAYAATHAAYGAAGAAEASNGDAYYAGRGAANAATYAAKAASGGLDLIALAEEAVGVVEEAN